MGDVAKSIDPFYYHTRARDSSSTADASLFNYVRPRLHDDSYRKRSIGDNTTPITTTIDDQSTIVNRFGFTSKRDETRAKSKSLHDLSPPDRTNLLDDIYHHHAPPSVPVRTSPGYNSYEPRKHAPTATSTTPSYFSAVRRHHTMVGYEDEVRYRIRFASLLRVNFRIRLSVLEAADAWNSGHMPAHRTACMRYEGTGCITFAPDLIEI